MAASGETETGGQQWWPRQLAPAAEGGSQARDLGLHVLAALIDGIDYSEPDVLVEPLQQLSQALEGLPAGALSEEWSPPQREPEKALEINDDEVSASTSDSSSATAYMARNAINDSSAIYRAQPNVKSTVFTIALKKAAWVGAVHVEWKLPPGKYTLLVRAAEAAGEDAEESVDEPHWKTHSSISVGAKDIARIPIGAELSGVRIRAEDFHKSRSKDSSTGSQYHGLKSIKLLAPDASKLHRSASDTLDDIAELLGRTVSACSSGGPAASHSSASDAAGVALRGLMAHVRASASLGSVLRLVDSTLNSYGEKAIPPEAAAASATFLRELRGAASEAVEIFMAGGSAKRGPITAKFDESAKSSGVNITDDGKKIESTSGSSQYCYVDVGFTKGKAAWEFVAERDNMSDECVCYGCGIKPITNGDYNSSANLWMVRGYNGQIYHSGTSGHRTVCKLHQDNVVRFELDHDEHTVRLIVDGNDQGIVFTDIPQQEIFPVVCTYSSGRVVRVEKVESEAVAAGADSAMIAEIAEDAMTATGLAADVPAGKRNGSDADIMVDGSSSVFDVALIPETDAGSEETSIKIEIESGEDGEPKWESIVGHVAVDDSSPDSALPAVFEVVGDDEVIWASEPLHAKGAANRTFFRVFLRGASTVTLRSRLETPTDDASAEGARIVLQAPRGCGKRDWSWVPQFGPDAPRDSTDGATTGLDVAAAMVDSLTAFAGIESRVTAPQTPDASVYDVEVDDLMPLEGRFAVQVSASVFSRLHKTLAQVLPVCASGSEQHIRMAVGLLSIMRANLARLTTSLVNPADVGIKLVADETTGERPTLAPVHEILQSIMAAESGYAKDIQLAAASTLDAGLTLLYPTAKERRELLESLIADGGVIEVQFAFPAPKQLTDDEKKRAEKAAKEGEKVPKLYDLRFERALLLLQVECEALGWPCHLDGKWGAYTHLVVGIPSSESGAAARASPAVDFLDSGFGTIMRKAGFESWTFPSGCESPKVSLKIERYLNFSLAERTFNADASGGFVRIYPRSAGSYEEVCSQVAGFLAKVEAAEDE